MSEEETVFTLYHRVHKELIRHIRRLSEPYDFNRGELPILGRLVKRGDGVTQKEIRGNLPISKSTISKTIDNLVKKGYLRKETDPNDKRLTRIYLTEKEEKIEKIIDEIDRKVEQIMLKDFSEEEKERLTFYLNKILENLKE